MSEPVLMTCYYLPIIRERGMTGRVGILERGEVGSCQLRALGAANNNAET